MELPSLRVLLVEDNSADRVLIEEELKSVFDVAFTYFSGLKELSKSAVGFKPGQFDLAIVDYHLPDGDGFKAAKIVSKFVDAIILVSGVRVYYPDTLKHPIKNFVLKPLKSANVRAVLDSGKRWNKTSA